MTDSNATELLPCPFCGGEAELVCDGFGVRIRCRNPRCRVNVHTIAYTSKHEAEAIEAWNTRADDKLEAITGVAVDAVNLFPDDKGYQLYVKRTLIKRLEELGVNV